MNRRTRTWMLRALVPLAFLTVLLRRALSPEVLLTRRDAFILYLPLKAFLARSLHAGNLPTWYPYDGLGVSYVGSTITGLFHPLNLLYLLLAPDQGLKWQSVLAYPIAAFGAALLARRLGARLPGQSLAAIGFAGSGYLLSVSDNLPYLLTAAVLPWSWLAAERVARRPDVRGAVGLAAALTLAALGGDVQGAVLQGATALVIVVFARRGARLRRLRAAALGGGLAGLVGLPQWLPTWATYAGSRRSVGLGLHTARLWSVHPLRLLELALGPLVPTALITGQDPVNDLLGGHAGELWARSELIGLPLVALALAALLRPLPRRLRLYAGFGAGALWLALGRYAGLYQLFFKFVPFWRAFRYPEKLMPVVVLPLCLLAAWGLRALVAADPRLTRALVAVLGLLLVWFALGTPGRVLQFATARASTAAALDTRTLAAISDCLRGRALLGLLLVSALWLLSVRGGRWTGWGAVLLNVAQLLVLSSWLIGVGPRARWLSLRSPFLPTALKEQGGGAARMCWHVPYYLYAGPELADPESQVLDSDLRVLAPPLGGLVGVRTVRAYIPGADAFFEAACGEEPDCGTACARVAGAGFGVIEADRRGAVEARAMQVLAEERDPRSILVRDPGARPFASLPAVRHVTAAQARKAIFDPQRRPAQEAILIGPGQDLPSPGGTITADRSTPGLIRADATLDHAGLAVFAVACAPGWRAELDGTPVPLQKADGSLCAVPAPAGTHHIVLRYRPWGWPWAFAGPLLALALFELARRRERRGDSERANIAARAAGARRR